MMDNSQFDQMHEIYLRINYLANRFNFIKVINATSLLKEIVVYFQIFSRYIFIFNFELTVFFTLICLHWDRNDLIS